MRCPTCGYQIDQYNLDRCPNCGNPLPTQAAQPTAENPPPQQPQYYPHPQYSPPPQPGAAPQPFGYPPSGYPPQPPEGNYPHQTATELLIYSTRAFPVADGIRPDSGHRALKLQRECRRLHRRRRVVLVLHQQG